LKVVYHKYIVVALIVIIGLLFHANILNEFPQYKHCWAQADRYALSIGFVNNGGDFFHPETNILNNQFPGDFEVPRETSITSVDFPIHDYIVSVLMRIFNTTSPWCFRLYTLLYSFLGLYFLYKLSYLFTKDFFKSLVVVLFAALSPTLLYYQSGFLPTIPSLANVIIALYFFFKYKDSQERKDFLWFGIFITLAILSRLPFAIVLVAIMCLEVLTIIRTKKINRLHVSVFILSISAVVVYYFYNNHLRNQYGSLFLNRLMPANNFDELVDFTSAVYQRWFFKYFTGYHYLIIVALLVLLIFGKVKLKLRSNAFQTSLLLLASIMIIGCLIYYRVMTFQFLDHDYYFLDTFFLPIILLLIYLVSQMPDFSITTWRYGITVFLLVLFIPAAINANKLQEEIRAFIPKPFTATNFEGSDIYLDSLGVPKSAKILVIAADGPNNPFILMKRKGYAVVYPWPEKIAKAMNWPFDYVVIENNKLQNDVYNAYPDIAYKLKKVASNGKITLFVKGNGKQPESLEQLIGTDNKQLIYKQNIGFDTIPVNCSGTEFLSDLAFSGKKSCLIKSDIEWSFGYKINSLKSMNTNSATMVVKGEFYAEVSPKDLLVCVSIKSGSKDILFQASDVASDLKLNSWNKKELVFQLPKVNESNFEMIVFIWNRAKSTAYLDDFEINIYQ